VTLLCRQPVAALSLAHVGKESHRLKEIESGLVHDPDEVYTECDDPAHGQWRALAVPALKQMSRSRLAEWAGM
jgi:hypothetical protein